VKLKTDAINSDKRFLLQFSISFAKFAKILNTMKKLQRFFRYFQYFTNLAFLSNYHVQKWCARITFADWWTSAVVEYITSADLC